MSLTPEQQEYMSLTLRIIGNILVGVPMYAVFRILGATKLEAGLTEIAVLIGFGCIVCSFRKQE